MWVLCFRNSLKWVSFMMVRQPINDVKDGIFLIQFVKRRAFKTHVPFRNLLLRSRNRFHSRRGGLQRSRHEKRAMWPWYLTGWVKVANQIHFLNSDSLSALAHLSERYFKLLVFILSLLRRTYLTSLAFKFSGVTSFRPPDQFLPRPSKLSGEA